MKIIKYLDPYTYLDLLLLKLFGKDDKRSVKIIYWIFYLLYSLLLAFLIFKLLGFLLGTSMPLATVVSGSMEPSFYRGDLMIISSAKKINAQQVYIDDFLNHKNISDFLKIDYDGGVVKSIEVDSKKIEIHDVVKNKNSVVVYKSNISGRDVIHRVVLLIKAKDGDFVITKGDNAFTNPIVDQDCILKNGFVMNGCIHVSGVAKQDLLGKKRVRIPFIGYIKLAFFKG